jgi:uncharacterized protein
VFKYLKSLFAKRPVAPPPEAPAIAKPLKTLSLAAFSRIMEQIGKEPAMMLDLPKSKCVAPALPPGVRPERASKGQYELMFAMDGTSRECDYMALDDGIGGQNFNWLNNSPFFGEVSLTFPGFAFLSQLQQISEYRAPCDVTSTEMTREWIKIVSKSNKASAAEKCKAIKERMEELKLQEQFQSVCLYDGQFGGGFLYWQFKGEESDAARQLPKMIEQIKKDSVLAVTAIEPYWCTPFSYNADRPEREDFYIPQSWFIMGRKTHLSRLMVIISRAVPDLLKPQYNFVGISLAQLMFPYIQRWLRTAKSVNDLINSFSIVNLKTNMQATLSDGGDNGVSLLQRLKIFTGTRNNQGIFATDKDDEELEILNATLSGLEKLQAQAQEHMAAPAHIPLIKLFGITPTGLGATGEGEIQVWYDWVHAQQNHALGDHMNRALEIVQMDLFGEVDDDISYEWETLFQPTPKEEGELRKADSERDAAYLTNSVVSPDEVRQKLIDDPKSGYNNLTGPAPEPEQDEGFDEDGNPLPVQGDPDAPAALEHASGEADKDRQHEAEQNDKDRKNALKLAAKKSAASK